MESFGDKIVSDFHVLNPINKIASGGDSLLFIESIRSNITRAVQQGTKILTIRCNELAASTTGVVGVTTSIANAATGRTSITTGRASITTGVAPVTTALNSITTGRASITTAVSSSSGSGTSSSSTSSSSTSQNQNESFGMKLLPAFYLTFIVFWIVFNWKDFWTLLLLEIATTKSTFPVLSLVNNRAHKKLAYLLEGNPFANVFENV